MEASYDPRTGKVVVVLTYWEARDNLDAGHNVLAAIGPLLAGIPPPSPSRIVAARNPREPWHRHNPSQQA
jgi:hypothetical protein